MSFFHFRARLLALVMVLTATGCWEAISVEDENDADSNADSDSDTSGLPDGEKCVTAVGILEGTCKKTDSLCQGGVYVVTPEGDCNAPGYICCINTDQCPALSETVWSWEKMHCQEDECPPDAGEQVGCPDNGWCCSD
ncbi:MAG: hypothetical protein GY854_00790 [Deltaproteobacteria bacterium]|nr:hypothetical protein [Deltaproteobacteria bacterium]